MGRKLITAIIKDFSLESFIKPPEAFSPIHYWNFELYMKKDPKMNMIPRESYATHLYNGLWRRGLKLPIPLFKIQGRLTDNVLFINI
ncbi:MAG: hypothetical protein ACFFAU_15045 [Candidatus Hodarchaeota archaeon]